MLLGLHRALILEWPASPRFAMNGEIDLAASPAMHQEAILDRCPQFPVREMPLKVLHVPLHWKLHPEESMRLRQV